MITTAIIIVSVYSAMAIPVGIVSHNKNKAKNQTQAGTALMMALAPVSFPAMVIGFFKNRKNVDSNG